jgi:hypothetical protein
MAGFDRLKDLQLTTAARSLLVKHWVNTDRLDIHVLRGIVEVRGRFEVKNAGHLHDREMMARLRTADMALRSLDGVRGVQWTLSDWAKGVDGWTRKASAKPRTPPGLGRAPDKPADSSSAHVAESRPPKDPPSADREGGSSSPPV